MFRLTSLFLVLVIALTSQAFALARGQSMAAGEMVLCVGGGFVTVAVDAEGQPVGPSHICPDGIVAFAGLTFVPELPLHMVEMRAAEAVRVAEKVAQGAAVLVLRARGPPVSV